MSIFRGAMALAAIALSIVFSFMSCSVAATESTLTLGGAVRATLQHNPQLAAYNFKAKALAGEQQSAALGTEWRLNTELENLAGSGNFRGTEAAELSISLASAFELGGQRDARLGLVTARQQQLASSQRVLSLDLVRELTQQFIQVLALQELLLLQQESYNASQQTLSSLERQVQAGAVADSELLRGRAAAVRAELELQQIRQRLASEQIRLSAFWASSTPAFTSVKGDLYAIPSMPSLPSLRAKLAANPDLALLAADIEVSSARVRQARSEAGGSLEWSTGVRRFQEYGDSALVIGLSMPLGNSKRAQGAIASASALQQEVEQQHAAARLQLETHLMTAYQTHQQAVTEVRALRDQVLPALKQAMGQTTHAFDQGRYSFLELNLAQAQLLDAQQALVAAASRMQASHIELERLIGSSLNEQNPEVAP